MKDVKKSKRVRGFAITTEAIMLSGLMAILLFFAFLYASNYFSTQTRLSQTWLEARLCGEVLTIKNVGTVQAYIKHVYGIDNSGNMEDITDSISQTTLSPGDSITVTLSTVYKEILIVGENFDKVVEPNECT